MNKEFIICAANHYDDNLYRELAPINITSGFVVLVCRHSDATRIFMMTLNKFPDAERGVIYAT